MQFSLIFLFSLIESILNSPKFSSKKNSYFIRLDVSKW